MFSVSPVFISFSCPVIHPFYFGVLFSWELLIIFLLAYHKIIFSFLLIIKVGDRCEVEPGEKRGVVKFVGRAQSLAPGFWVGVQYDEPLGKHDGM